MIFTAERLQTLIGLSWKAYLNPETRFYPVFASLEDLRDTFAKANEKGMIMYLEDKEEMGVLCLSAEVESHYLQANGGIIALKDFERVAVEFEKRLIQNFTGFSFFTGYPSSNQRAIHFLESHGYRCFDRMLRYEASCSAVSLKSDGAKFHRLSEGFYARFMEFHHRLNSQMYWNAERIIDHRQEWIVMVNDEAEQYRSSGARLYEDGDQLMAEIYFVNDGPDEYASIDALLVELQRCSVSSVLFLIDAEATQCAEYCASLGFVLKDDYQGYMKVIGEVQVDEKQR